MQIDRLSKSGSKVAIALATYNGEHYLREQLDSFLNQTYTNWICYIHDDGSSDNTIAIINEYTRIYSERFVNLQYAPLHSASKNFLSILRYIEDPYVMFADQDDVWELNKIELELQEMIKVEQDNNPIPILVFSDLSVVDKDLNFIADSFASFANLSPHNTEFNRLIIENVIPGCTILMNKLAYELARQCPNYEHVVMHDMWCGLVVSSTGIISYVNKPTSLYRQHQNNVRGTRKRKNKIAYLVKYMSHILNRENYMEELERLNIKINQVLMLKDFDIKVDAKNLISKISSIKKASFVNRYQLFKKDFCLGPLRSLEYAFMVKHVQMDGK